MREPIHPIRSRARIAADNRDELAAWIDERAAELTARGLDSGEAQRQALEEFGDAARAEQYANRQDAAANRRDRAVLWLEEMRADLTIAVRTLARTPAVTTIVLLTFALGIGATTAVFSVVHATLLRALPYGGEETLVYLPAVDRGVIRPGLGGARFSAHTVVALRAQATSFAAMAHIETGNVVISAGGDPEQVMMSMLSPNALDVLQARAAIGRTFVAGDESDADNRVVILLDDIWRRRFGGDPAIVGRTIELSEGARRVIGVMPAGFRVPTYEAAELLAPRDLTPLLRHPNNVNVRTFRVFARLKPGISTDIAQADVDRVLRTLRRELPRVYEGIEAQVVDIRTAVAGAARARLLVLMGAAGFVLLIACANIAGILLSRALARRHELSVRVALGAGRRRLMRQFLAEGTILAAFGVTLGALFAQVGIHALRTMTTTSLPAGTTFALEPRVLVFAIVAAVLTALVSSLVPALAATRGLGSALRRDDARTSMSPGSRRVRMGLVASQLAVSVVLLVGAGLFLRTLYRLSILDLGYGTERALTFRLPFSRPKTATEQDAFWATLYAQLRAIPGVLSVGGGNVPTSGQGTVVGLAIEGRSLERTRLPDVRYTPASDDYFATLGIPILRGRSFNADDRDGSPWVAVVSAGLARQLWPGADPIGARVKPEPQKPWATIVGIVGDVRMGGADAPQPSIYTSQRQDHWPGGGSVIIRTTSDPLTIASAVRQVVKRIEPAMPIVGMRTLDDFRRSTPAIADRRLQMQLMATFAILALAVSAIGVYGVNAYSMEARRRELGIRIALGASRARVLWLALRDAAQIVATGLFAGIPIAWLLAARLREMLFEVAPFDLLTVVAVSGTLLLVVLIASAVPARRATLIDPAKAMRVD